MSLKQCAALLGRNRTTVEKWIDLGCPYVTKANRDLGVAWSAAECRVPMTKCVFSGAHSARAEIEKFIVDKWLG